MRPHGLPHIQSNVFPPAHNCGIITQGCCAPSMANRCANICQKGYSYFQENAVSYAGILHRYAGAWTCYYVVRLDVCNAVNTAVRLKATTACGALAARLRCSAHFLQYCTCHRMRLPYQRHDQLKLSLTW